MSKAVYLKILMLLVALGAVVFVMNRMSPERVSHGLEQMGLQAATPVQEAHVPLMAEATPNTTPGPVANGKINLCRTRVHAIVWPDGRKIQEASGGLKAKWQAYNLTPTDIGSMDVEKWLSLHCESAVTFRDTDQKVKGSATAIEPYVTFVYIDGTQEKLDRSADGVYRFDHKIFTSNELTQAMEALISLAKLEPQGP